MRFLLLAVPLYLYAVGWRETRRARREVSEYGRSRYLLLLWLGPHAGRRYFTEQGWTAQRRALAFTLLGWLSAVACLVVIFVF